MYSTSLDLIEVRLCYTELVADYCIISEHSCVMKGKLPIPKSKV